MTVPMRAKKSEVVDLGGKKTWGGGGGGCLRGGARGGAGGGKIVGGAGRDWGSWGVSMYGTLGSGKRKFRCSSVWDDLSLPARGSKN